MTARSHPIKATDQFAPRKTPCQRGAFTYESEIVRSGNLEAYERSRGKDGGSGAMHDLIETELNEPADAAEQWDLYCGYCSGRMAFGEAMWAPTMWSH